MTEKEQREIFAKNFRKYVDGSGKTQREIAKDLGYSYTTVNTWYRGAAMPNAAKIQTIADYFRIGKSDLLDDEVEGYYTNAETARLAQEMFEDPQMRSLFHMKRNMEPEKFSAHYDMMKKMYQLEHPEDSDDYFGA